MSDIEAPEIGITEIDTLLRYLPAFSDSGFKPGHWVVEGGHSPYFQPNPLVDEFVQAIVREQIIIQFDWSSWIEGARGYMDDSEAIAGADLLTLRKLLTAHVRGDRFTEGVLASVFESGHILAILKRLEQIRAELV